MSFLHPAFLLSLLAIAVPVVIHLWNVKQGKTLRIGSIALLGTSARRSSKRLQLDDLPLLLLRILLIVLLAILLAGPVLRKSPSSGSNNWILVEKANSAVVYRQFQPVIDSLLQAGYSLHAFDESFEELPREALRQPEHPLPERTGTSYWSLLSLLDQRAEKPARAWLFTNDRVNRFSGKRPQISWPLTWKMYTPADSVHYWIQEASLTATDSIRALVGTSTSSAITFRPYLLTATSASPVFDLKVNEGTLRVNLKAGSLGRGSTDTSVFPVDTTTFRVAIVAKDYPDDARYVASALRAYHKFSGKNIDVQTLADGDRINENYSFVFWLSDVPAPAALNVPLLYYKKGKPVVAENSIHFPEGQPPLDLLKRVPADPKSTSLGLPVWADGFGDPLLERQTDGSLALYTHFNPEWNDLVWNDRFAEQVAGLLFPAPEVASRHDRRAMNFQEALPEILTANRTAEHPLFPENKPLDRYFWLAAFVVFAIERLWSSLKKSPDANS